MSTEVSIFEKKGIIATDGRRVTKLGQALASKSNYRRIQTNTNGTFKCIVNGEQIGKAVRGHLDVIIVNALPKVSRMYYEKDYDPSADASAPDCWSNLGDVPDPKAPKQQSASCETCPQNIAGSGKQGGRACRFQRRLAVMLAGDPRGDLYQINIPAKSLFGKGHGNTHPFESYCNFLGQHGESPDTVVTRISYDDEAETLQLMFTPMEPLSDEQYAKVVEAQAKPEADKYVRLTVAEVDGVTPAPKVEAKPEPKAEPEEPEGNPFGVSEDKEEAIEGELEEKPVKRKTAKAKKPEPIEVDTEEGDELSAVIAEWGAGDE